MFFSPLQIAYLVIPVIIVFIFSAIFPVGDDAGSSIYFRPPGWFFTFIWIVLLILFGLSWALSDKTDVSKVGVNICYIVTLCLLIAWIILQNKKVKKKIQAWVLFVTLMMSLYCYTLVKKNSKLCLVPLLTWVLFAIWMSIAEIIRIYPKKSIDVSNM